MYLAGRWGGRKITTSNGRYVCGFSVRMRQTATAYAPLARPWLITNQVSSLTEEDVARIAERERQERGVDSGSADPEAASGTDGSNDDPLAAPASRQSMTTNAEVRGSISPSSTSPSKSRLLMGVPIAEGVNVTKFLYVEVPDDRKETPSVRDGSVGSSEFDFEGAAARLCTDLHGEGQEGQVFLECLSSLKVTLSSR